MLLAVRRWHPNRQVVVVADRTYASLKLLDRCRSLTSPITFVTRLRLDAALYEPAPPRKPGQIGRPRLKGKRLPNLSAVVEDPATAWTPITVSDLYGEGERVVEIVTATAVWYSTGLYGYAPALDVGPRSVGHLHHPGALCTDLGADPKRILSWFVMRWQMETTFQQACRHLGFETQRQWSELAIRRATPALLGLFSLVTLFAHRRMTMKTGTVRRSAWYDKEPPTFADALALVHGELWARETFCESPLGTDTVEVPRALMERLTDAICYAA